MENKICWVCEQYKNPYRDNDGTKINPENFITIHWFGEETTDDAHEECWNREK
ncbi:MAG TPA: hypothetical protein VLB80_02900 [Candidatus Babeliales bacterium]|nr:hypothetical protein [Candidatus Babeliales bacterium]